MAKLIEQSILVTFFKLIKESDQSSNILDLELESAIISNISELTESMLVNTGIVVEVSSIKD